MKMTSDVRWLGQRLDAGLAEALGTDGFTTTQLVILEAVNANDRASQRALCAKTCIDRSTLSEVLRRLVASGHVQRADNPADARAYEVRMTAAGKKAFLAAAPKLIKVEQSLVTEARKLVLSW